MEPPAKIRKLDEVVVNRIAAGEIIQRPANALKELIENCLDAKSTQIQVSAKEGGLKLLQIQDNGTGIRKEDMDIVCERFTTSKLQNFDDLKSITTYGFRGEALASISHVALLTITTKTAKDRCAYRASYVDGKLKAPPVPCAGNQGTIITVENLFYNVATRRKALSSSGEEFARINDVVTKYAIHNPSIGFTLKKNNESGTQIRTPHSSTKIDNIRLLYGNNVAREILEVELDDSSYKFKFQALITNPNYSNKRSTIIVFINHRLVESTPIRKNIEDLYTVYLPKKGHPWCYISLMIEPQNIDVNVHPTKQEVRFCHEDVIIEKMRNAIDEKLAVSDASRTFYIQAKLPKLDLSKELLEGDFPDDETDTGKKLHPKDMIRTDSFDQKLTKFNFTSSKKNKESEENYQVVDKKIETETTNIDIDLNTVNNKSKISNTSMEIDDQNNQSKTSNILMEIDDENDESKIPNISMEATDQNYQPKISNISKEVNDQNDELQYEEVLNPVEDELENNLIYEPQKTNDIDENTTNEKKENSKEEKPHFKSYSVNEIQVETKLLSILTLRKEVEDDYHEGLRAVISELILVGCIDENNALVQSGVKLYLFNTQKFVEELFYQIMLYDFANYGVIKFSEPVSIKDLAILGLETKEAGWSEEVGSKELLSTRVQELLLEKADMLRQYFSIYIDKNGNLKSLPILIENYFPNPAEIPLYILRLSTEVNWSKEKPCFHDICRETAKFYSRIDVSDDSWKEITDNILYSAVKESLLPPKHFVNDSTVIEVTSLPELYKVFERC